MADERTCYAGDLTTDQIGKQVSVTAKTGARITDELVEVRHSSADVMGAKSEQPPRVWVRFRNVIPDRDMHTFDQEGSSGFWLGHTDHVEVL